MDASRREVTLKHEDIPGFMPGMTMAFRVGAPGLLEGRVPGELVKATLVVRGTEAHLSTLVPTGVAPLPQPSPSTRVMNVLAVGDQVADAALIDERGARRSLSDWRGRKVAVTFIYTRCPLPDFCPLMDRHFKAVQDQVLGDAGLKGQVRLLSVSFDPEHDTPVVLARRAAALGADPSVWQFATGSPEEVERFASQFGVSLIRDASGAAEIVHNLRTAVIDGNGRVTAILSGSDWTPADLLAELRTARGGD